MISSVSLSPISGTRIVANFSPRPYYFVTKKGNTELVQKLDEAMTLMNQVDPNLQDKLFDTYFRTASNSFVLNEAQKQKLARMNTLRVLCAQYAAPYIYEKDKKACGLLASVLNDFSKEVGVKISYEFSASREDMVSKLEKADYDLILGINMTSGRCSQYGFINSVPVLESVLCFAQKPENTATAKRIAIMKGLEEQYPVSEYEEVIYCDSSKDCIKAVEQGKADIAFASRDAMQYYIYESGSTLVTSLVPGQTVNVTFPVSRKSDSALLTALNGYIDSISETDLTSYISEANLHKDTISISLFIKRNPLSASLILGSIVLVIAAIIFFFVIRSIKQKEKLQLAHNKQLSDALEIADEANKAKTTFLSNMSHDIRTPMNAVIGFSTLLAKNPSDETKVKEYSRKITAASNHLLGLINDILDITKIENGKMSLHQSVFSLDELVSSVNVVIRPMANAKKQELRINVGAMNHELFIGDKTRLNQILINLLSNSIKYTPEGGQIMLEITDNGQSSPSIERLRFVVADNGYGISDEFKKVIFEPFTRAEDSTINKEVGTGLGLAITKNIIDLMGGTISLDSKLGKGSIFTVDLSLRLTHEEEDENFWANHNVSRILLVDDEKSICDGIKETMKNTGVSFDACYSGMDAIKLVRERYEEHQEYNTIILDWQMPGMNGLDTAKEIRKIVPVDTPILFLTSYDWTDIETKALEIDIDGFLAKPFTEVNLKEKLIEVERFKNSVSEDDSVMDLGGMHFLLAEDNDLNAEIVVELLKSEGADCVVAKNGKEAVDLFEKSEPKHFNAILMDVMMPVMDGYEATKAIRRSSHQDAKDIPIIAMTASAFVKDVQDALDSGMNAHLAKPIHIDALKNTLTSCKKKIEASEEKQKEGLTK